MLLMTVEEHGDGDKCFAIFYPRVHDDRGKWAFVLATLLTMGAELDRIWSVATVLGALSFLVLLHSLAECGLAMAVAVRALRKIHGPQPAPGSEGSRDSAPMPPNGPDLKTTPAGGFPRSGLC